MRPAAALLLLAALSGCIQVTIESPAAPPPTPQDGAAESVQAPREPALAVDFRATPEVGTAGRPVQFQATVQGQGGRSIDTWRWEFGDGRTADAPAASHAFAEAGEYRVVLRVLASDGTVAEKARTLVVVNPR